MSENQNTTPPFSNIPAPPAAAATETVEVVAEKKERRSVTIPANAVEVVVANIKTKSYAEMAAMLSTDDNVLEGRDVNNIIQKIKKTMRASAGKDGYGTRTLTNKKTGKEKTVQDFDAPLTDQAKKIESWLSDNLSRPEAVKVARAAKGPRQPKNDALTQDITNILASL